MSGYALATQIVLGIALVALVRAIQEFVPVPKHRLYMIGWLMVAMVAIVIRSFL